MSENKNNTENPGQSSSEAVSPKKETNEPKNKKVLSPAEKFAELAKGKGKKQKVEFIASPTGLLKLGYHIGDKASFDEKQVEMLQELGLAKTV
jgi:hypothetical protein